MGLDFLPDAKQVETQAQPQIDPYLAMAADPYMQMPAQNFLTQKDFLEVLKHYAEDETIPDDVKTSKWAIFGKALSLTFLEERDLPLIDMYTNVLRIDSLMSQPSHMLTFEQTHQMDQTQLYFYLQAKRAIGTNQGKVNERTLQVTQIAQSINTQTGSGQQKQSNMMARLRSLF